MLQYWGSFHLGSCKDSVRNLWDSLVCAESISLGVAGCWESVRFYVPGKQVAPKLGLPVVDSALL